MQRITKLFLILSVLGLISAGCNEQSRLPTTNPSSRADESARSGAGYPLPTNAEQSIQVRQMVEGDMADSLFNIYPAENKTALELLKMGHQVETKTFSGAGEYVVSINGKKEDTGKNFWAFYVNNKQATEGASTYKPKNKDFIEWKLEIIK
jgi:Domain of unknown function (DUF4430)